MEEADNGQNLVSSIEPSCSVTASWWRFAPGRFASPISRRSKSGAISWASATDTTCSSKQKRPRRDAASKHHSRLNSYPISEKYLHMYRPVFWRNPKRDLRHRNKLWLSSWGRGLCDNMVYQRVMKLTKSRLGVAINPHAFRHAAATSIAFGDPEHVQIVINILGHTTLATSERYYILAQTTEAARRYHDHIDKLRKESASGAS